MGANVTKDSKLTIHSLSLNKEGSEKLENNK